MKRIALIDGDSIAYMAGISFSKGEMKASIDYKINQILNDTNADYYELYIEDWVKTKTNFRIKLFQKSKLHKKTQSYKGNREGAAKPKFLDEAREYMVKSWNANVVRNIESEDRVIARAYECKQMHPIICHIDKDLLQHPLEYYNYNTGKTCTLTLEEATLNLWRQVCTGDATDNIPGIPKVGKVKAGKAITDWELAHLQAAQLYASKDLCYDYFIEQYNLIYIRHTTSTRVLKPITKKQYQEFIDG
jgi:hypothetical protein